MLSDYLCPKMLDHWFGATVPAVPSTIYLGLSLTRPEYDGANITEPSGGAYVRLSLNNDTANWENTVSCQKKNKLAFAFVTATADWGSFPYWFISDASTAGNMLLSGELDIVVPIDNGDTFTFDVGDLVISLR